jgi:hypothetical protein
VIILHLQVSIPAVIYITEMASSSTRCMLVTWPSLAVSIGILLVYALGLVIQEWRTIAAVATFVPIITLISIFAFVRESPVWLLARGRDEEAKKSFEWIRCVNGSRNMSREVQREFETLIESRKKLRESVDKLSPGDAEERGTNLPLCQNSGATYGTDGFAFKQGHHNNLCSAVLSSLKRPDVWKPLLILNCYFFFMQFSGIPVLVAYAVNIMMSEGVSLEPYLATLLLGVVKLLFEIAAGFIQNRQVSYKKNDSFEHRGNISGTLYEGISKSFRTGRLERELQTVQPSATSCTCIAILLVSLVSFAATILYVECILLCVLSAIRDFRL